MAAAETTNRTVSVGVQAEVEDDRQQAERRRCQQRHRGRASTAGRRIGEAGRGVAWLRRRIVIRRMLAGGPGGDDLAHPSRKPARSIAPRDLRARSSRRPRIARGDPRRTLRARIPVRRQGPDDGARAGRGTLLFGGCRRPRQSRHPRPSRFGSVIWLVLLGRDRRRPTSGRSCSVLVPSQGSRPRGVLRLADARRSARRAAAVGGLDARAVAPARGPGRVARSRWPARLPADRACWPCCSSSRPASPVVAHGARSLCSRLDGRPCPDRRQGGRLRPGRQRTSTRRSALRASTSSRGPAPAVDVHARPGGWPQSPAGMRATSSPTDGRSSTGRSSTSSSIRCDLLDVRQARGRRAGTSRHGQPAGDQRPRTLTISAEAQAIEDRITRSRARRAPTPDGAAADPTTAARDELTAIDARWRPIEAPYEEWEVLYRQRLQVERDLRAGLDVGSASSAATVHGAGALPGPDRGRCGWDDRWSARPPGRLVGRSDRRGDAKAARQGRRRRRCAAGRRR